MHTILGTSSSFAAEPQKGIAALRSVRWLVEGLHEFGVEVVCRFSGTILSHAPPPAPRLSTSGAHESQASQPRPSHAPLNVSAAPRRDAKRHGENAQSEVDLPAASSAAFSAFCAAIRAAFASVSSFSLVL